jgi:glutamate-1-semialdehyde 2,1-aminomutase
MTHKFAQSQKLFDRAGAMIPAGVNSNTRARHPHPIYFSKADGAHLTDVDGNRIIDILMGNGAILLGHKNRVVQDAVMSALDSGLTTGVESARAGALAERFLGIIKTMDMVRFTNTGTEAVLHALRLARYATGRAKIAKAEGSYHGWSDDVFTSVWPDLTKAGDPDDIRPLPGTPGQQLNMVEDTLILPFNDIANSVAAIERHADALAAVILEPILIDIGFIPAAKAYLSALRDTCSRHGIVLIYDELLTAFNVAPGGVQEIQGVIPDLAVYGKALGNGYPIAALAGSETLMRMLEPGKGPVFVGTFNGHTLAVAAAHAALGELASGDVQTRVNARTQWLISTFNQSAHKLGVPAQMHGGGSHFQWYFTDQPIRDYRSAAHSNAAAYGAFVAALFDRSTLFLPNPLSHHAISLAHDDEVVEQLVEIFESGLQASANATGQG